jgi:hypothetical protein
VDRIKQHIRDIVSSQLAVGSSLHRLHERGGKKKKRDAHRKKQRTSTKTQNNAKRWGRMLKIVVIKLIEPKIEETPDKWRLKMAKSTDPPEWLVIPLKGG